MGKKEEMEFIYHYNEPKTQEEKEEQEMHLRRAYGIIFEATFEKNNWFEKFLK